MQARVGNSITPLSRFRYGGQSGNLISRRAARHYDTHAQEAMQRCWLGSTPGVRAARRPVVSYHGTHPRVATVRVRTTRKRIGLSPQPKDRAEPADRAAAHHSAEDPSAHPYLQSSQPCQ
ncbi:MAG: hypothetical protein QOJ20_5709 [Mycobacterium sp.]|nr:hypothetical protein [Mycobacterium sp.]